MAGDIGISVVVEYSEIEALMGVEGTLSPERDFKEGGLI